ncbi:hypothetical protein LCGC14_0679760 [marine sediment metagenome]|uniref:Uncharacterized protein n=1 Tax=marine sediment metagenome TaxID=412755 RepID=A0A0F9TWH9_9ZZZZ
MIDWIWRKIVGSGGGVSIDGDVIILQVGRLAEAELTPTKAREMARHLIRLADKIEGN